MFGRLQDQWRKLSSFLFSILPLFLVIFVEADSLPVPQQILDSCHILQVPLGLMIKAVSSNGFSLAVECGLKTSLISSRALASPQLQLGQLPLRDIPTRPRPPSTSTCYYITAGQFTMWGWNKGCANSDDQLRRSGQDNLHRDSSPTFLAARPPPLVPLR